MNELIRYHIRNIPIKLLIMSVASIYFIARNLYSLENSDISYFSFNNNSTVPFDPSINGTFDENGYSPEVVERNQNYLILMIVLIIIIVILRILNKDEDPEEYEENCEEAEVESEKKFN